MQMKVIVTVLKYRIAGFFKEGNFHEFHESIAICETFTLEILCCKRVKNIIASSLMSKSKG